MDASKAAALGIIPLDQLYLLAIVQTMKNEKLDAVLQDFGNDNGRLWLVRQGSTVPDAYLDFNFGKDSVAFLYTTRGERVLGPVTVKYAEGVDGYLESLTKFMHANRLASPTKSRVSA